MFLFIEYKNENIYKFIKIKGKRVKNKYTITYME